MPDIRKVKTKNGGDLLVDFNLLNPEQQSAAMQYTPAAMPAEDPAMLKARQDAELFGTPVEMPPLPPEPVQPVQPAQPPPTYHASDDALFNHAFGRDTRPSSHQVAPAYPEPAAMVAPDDAQPPQPEPQPTQPPVQVVEDKMPSMGIAYTPGHRGGGGGGNKKILGAMDTEKQAIEQGYAAQAAGAGNAAAVYDDALAKIEARNQEMEQKRAASEAATNEAMKRHDQAIDEVRSMKIDPEHYMNSRTTGQKIMMGFAIGLKHGNDSFLKDAINRDIDAQTAGIKTKMEYVNGLKVSVDMKKDMLHDLDQQAAMRSAQVLESAKLKIESITARTTSETAKAEGDKVIAQLTQRQEAIKAQMAAQAAARAAAKVQPWIMTPGGVLPVTTDQYLKHLEKMGDGGLTASERLQRDRFEYDKAKDRDARTVDGYVGTSPSGLGKSETLVAGFAKAKPAYDVTLKGLEDMAKINKDSSVFGRAFSSLNPQKKADIETLLSTTQLIFKGLGPIELGALSGGDTKFVKDIIRNPMAIINQADGIARARKLVAIMRDEHAGAAGLKRSNAPSSGVKVGL